MAKETVLEVGSVVSDLPPGSNGRRGAKSKWGPKFETARGNSGWTVIGIGDDEDHARRIYNNARMAKTRYEKEMAGNSLAMNISLAIRGNIVYCSTT